MRRHIHYILLGLLMLCQAQLSYARGTLPVATTAANQFTIDFDRLQDLDTITSQFQNIGITFDGAKVLGQGASLNYLNFPPISGLNVIYDDLESANKGLITVTFDSSLAPDVTRVSAYVTGNFNIVMTAYSADNTALGSQSTGGLNSAPQGTPNKLLEINTQVPIQKVTFSNGIAVANTFTIDDFAFNSGQPCQITGIPLYKQGGAAEWAGDSYGGSTTQTWYDDKGIRGTMGAYGCTTTSAAMIVSYYATLQGKATTSPRDLNDWLRQHDGYSGGSILWPKVAEFAREVKGMQLYYYEGRGPDDGVVNASICNNAPVILNTKTAPYGGGHFLVAKGVSSDTSWQINDPGGANWQTMSKDADVGYRTYGTTYQKPDYLSVVIHPKRKGVASTTNQAMAGTNTLPAITIMDPANRKLIYTPTDQTLSNQILNSVYQSETIGSREDTTSFTESYIFSTGAPLDGSYKLEILSSEDGSYQVDVIAYDASGKSRMISSYIPLPKAGPFSINIAYSLGSSNELTVEVDTPNVSTLFLPSISK